MISAWGRYLSGSGLLPRAATAGLAAETPQGNELAVRIRNDHEGFERIACAQGDSPGNLSRGLEVVRAVR